MKKTNIFLIMILSTFCIFSCSKEEVGNTEDKTAENKEEIINSSLTLRKGTLKFKDKETLKKFVENPEPDYLKNTVTSLRKQGFKSLRPYFNHNDNKSIDSFLKEKKVNKKKNGYLYSLKASDNDNLDLDDELISDQNFASLLNEDREIYVGDSIYRYTTNGVYFTSIKNEDKLDFYLDSLNTTITNKSQILLDRKMNRMVENQDGQLSITPVEGEITQINNSISHYQPTYIAPIDGGGGSGGGGGGGSTPPAPEKNYPILIPQKFGSCLYSEDSLWQQAFGNRIKCNDYHDSEHRIQTQFWNENYFIYASIGTKAKYQKKRFIGWSESETADYVELGINSIKYTYNHNVNQYNPFTETHLQFKYKGVTYNQNGTRASLPTNPDPWPIFNENQVFYSLDIYIDDIFGQTIDETINLDGENINDAIEDLLEMAANSLPSTLDLQNDINGNKVAVKILKFSTNKTEVVIANRVIRHKSNARKTFDFNFLLTLPDNVSDPNFKDFLKQFSATKYDVAEVDLYGAGLRGNIWKGKRITAKD